MRSPRLLRNTLQGAYRATCVTFRRDTRPVHPRAPAQGCIAKAEGRGIGAGTRAVEGVGKTVWSGCPPLRMPLAPAGAGWLGHRPGPLKGSGVNTLSLSNAPLDQTPL